MSITERILDPCCGSRMMWFDRGHPAAIFGDIRDETLTVADRSHGHVDGKRTIHIHPDMPMDFRALPFPDNSFRLVAFDPPHLVRAGDQSWLAAKYGKLGRDWRKDLRLGFAECFRVLEPEGVLIFKWNETQVTLREVLALAPVRPLFGNTSGKKAGTHWMVFMKEDKMSEELKLSPCPVCGGKAFVTTVEHTSDSRPHGYRFCGRVMCMNCQASAGPTGFDATKEEADLKAIKRWNTRPIEDALRAENAKLKGRAEAAEEALMTVNDWRKLGSEITWDDVVTAYAKWEALK